MISRFAKSLFIIILAIVSLPVNHYIHAVDLSFCVVSVYIGSVGYVTPTIPSVH